MVEDRPGSSPRSLGRALVPKFDMAIGDMTISRHRAYRHEGEKTQHIMLRHDRMLLKINM